MAVRKASTCTGQYKERKERGKQKTVSGLLHNVVHEVTNRRSQVT